MHYFFPILRRFWLAVISVRPEKAFTTPDVESDCVALLSTGLFKNARPVFRRPNNLDGPHFVEVKGNQLATVPPLGTVEFLVTPRVLPAPTSFSVRIDSSLAKAGTISQQSHILLPITILKYGREVTRLVLHMICALQAHYWSWG